jgi:hypothetical protein
MTKDKEAVNDVILRIFMILSFASIKIYNQVTLFVYKDLKCFRLIISIFYLRIRRGRAKEVRMVTSSLKIVHRVCGLMIMKPMHFAAD